MSLRNLLYIIAAVTLLAGLESAVLIYMNVDDTAENVSSYELARSKSYLRNLRVYGGEMAILEYDMRRWFYSLWQGTSLAYTVGFITIALSGALYLTARLLPITKRPETLDHRP